jgi:hypothetical protein
MKTAEKNQTQNPQKQEARSKSIFQFPFIVGIGM